MDILMVAPDRPELNNTFEMREIQRKHNVKILSGNVTKQDIFQWCRGADYKVIHFLGHGGEQGFWMSNGDVLTREDIATVCRMAHVTAIFANSCNMIGAMSEATFRGVDIAIFATYEIDANDAWQMPLVFYSGVGTGTHQEIVDAYEQAGGHSSQYSIIFAPSLLKYLWLRIKELSDQVGVMEAQLLRLGVNSTALLTCRHILIWLVLWLSIFLSLLMVMTRLIKLW